MKIDMHVHTERHSGCAAMSPEAMAQAAIRRGLDAVVITEHDYLWSEDEVRELQAQFPALKILRGIEVSVEEGHALVYGVTRAETGAFAFKMPLSALADIVHGAGGVVMLAHPARYEDVVPETVFHTDLDGVEVFSMNVRMYMEAAIQHLQASMGLPGIAGTDAHVTDSLGYYATDFRAAIDTERDLVDALKAGVFSVMCDARRVRAFNRQLDGQVVHLAELFRETGLSSSEIKAQYRYSYSFQRGVREGKDVRLRAACEGDL